MSDWFEKYKKRKKIDLEKKIDELKLEDLFDSLFREYK